MKWIVIATTLLIPFLGSTQTEICGKILDQRGEALPGANVYIENSYDGTSSATDGSFCFSTDENGSHLLVVEFVGFERWQQEIKLSGKKVTVEVSLKEKFNELKAASVTAGAFEASDSRKAVVLKPLDIVSTAGAAGDVVGALQTLPGTTTVGESGRLFVRGGHSDESQTFIDGLMVFSPYGAAAPNTATRGRFNPFMFSGTTFSTGGYSAEYGQALSSVLLLETNDMPVQDQLDIGILSVGADVSGTKKLGTSAVTAHAGYFNLAPYVGVVPQNFDWVKPFESMESSVSFRQSTGNSGILKVYGTVSRSGFKLNQQHPEYDNGRSVGITNDNLFSNASWSGLLGERSTLRTGVSWTHDVVDMRLEQDGLKETLRGGHAKAVVGTRLHDRIKINNGVEFYYRDLGREYSSESGTFNQSFESIRPAAFSEAEMYASNTLVFRAGIRAEQSTRVGRGDIAPRLSAAIKTGDDAQFSLAWGTFYQDPWNDYLFSDADINSERAEHFIANYQWLTDLRTFRVEVYHKKYDDLAVAGEQGITSQGSGYATGLDLFWRDKKTIRNGDYWISYSYLDTERMWRDYPEMAIPGFASKHNLSVVYKHWVDHWRTMFGGTLQYSSPRRYNDPNVAEFNSRTTPEYVSLDLNCAWLYRQDVIFYVAATNVLGRQPVFGYEYSSEPNGQGIYERVPVVPSAPRFFILGCFITFSKDGQQNQMDKIN